MILSLCLFSKKHYKPRIIFYISKWITVPHNSLPRVFLYYCSTLSEFPLTPNLPFPLSPAPLHFTSPFNSHFHLAQEWTQTDRELKPIVMQDTAAVEQNSVSPVNCYSDLHECLQCLWMWLIISIPLSPVKTPTESQIVGFLWTYMIMCTPNNKKFIR